MEKLPPMMFTVTAPWKLNILVDGAVTCGECVSVVV